MTTNKIENAQSTNGTTTPSRQDLEKRGNGSPLHRSAFRALVQDFAPIWFTWCMNSGILGILTHQCPYQFPGLGIISTVFYVLDLVLFIFFSIFYTLRFAMFKQQAYNEVKSNENDLLFTACWPIAFMTLTTLTPLVCSNAYWGHHAFTILGYVMWWIVVVWCLVVMLWAFGILISTKSASDRPVSMLIILPAVSVTTASVTGAFVVSLSYDVSPRLAVPVIVVGFMLVGLGTLLGLMLTTYLFYGYLANGWPPPPQTATVFIFVGPMGQGAAALQQLGRAARVYGAFSGYQKGNFLTAEAAVPLEAACVMVALMLIGLGIIWVFLGIYAMVMRAFQRQLTWTPSWNAIIFPTATLVTAMSLFGLELDSPAFRVVTTGMIIILVIVFLVNVVFTVWKIWRGELLVVREDWRVKKKMEEEQKER